MRKKKRSWMNCQKFEKIQRFLISLVERKRGFNFVEKMKNQLENIKQLETLSNFISEEEFENISLYIEIEHKLVSMIESGDLVNLQKF
jgi:hypothetical protein